jgi:hypothetical protein
VDVAPGGKDPGAVAQEVAAHGWEDVLAWNGTWELERSGGNGNPGLYSLTTVLFRRIVLENIRAEATLLAKCNLKVSLVRPSIVADFQ